MVYLGLKRHFPGPGGVGGVGEAVLQLLSALAPGLIISGGKGELGIHWCSQFKVPY